MCCASVSLCIISETAQRIRIDICYWTVYIDSFRENSGLVRISRIEQVSGQVLVMTWWEESPALPPKQPLAEKIIPSTSRRTAIETYRFSRKRLVIQTNGFIT
jgi:hypothetical protein